MLAIIIAALVVAAILVILLVQIRANRWLHRRVEDLERKVQRIEAEQEVDCILADADPYSGRAPPRLRLIRRGMIGVILLIALYWRQMVAWFQAKPMNAVGIAMAGASVTTAFALPFTVNPVPHGPSPALAPPSTAPAPNPSRPALRRRTPGPPRAPTPTTPPPSPADSAVPADDQAEPTEPDPTRTDSPDKGGGGDGGHSQPSTEPPSTPTATSRPPESGSSKDGICLDVLIVGVCIGKSDHG